VSKRLLALALLAASWPVFGQVSSQTRGIDLVPFKLAPSMYSGLILDGAETPRKGAYHFDAVLDLNFGVLGLNNGDMRIGSLMPFRADLHLMGSYQLLNRLELGGDLPVTVYQLPAWQLLDQQGFPDPNGVPHRVGLGAPRIFARFNLLSQKSWPIAAAALMEIRFPIGDTYSFMSDKGVVFAPRVALERSIGPIRILANVGYHFRTSPGQYLNLYVGHEFVAGAGAQLNLPDIAAKLTGNRLMFDLNLATPAEAPFTFASSAALKTPIEIMAGLQTHIKEHWGVQLALAKGLGLDGYGREAFRVVLAARYEFEPEIDTDGDGIPDRIDKCPTIPENFNGYQDEDGCPEPDPDSDGDGIPDKVDGCKDIPGPAEYDGCPDRDGDQIPDNVDKCPDEFGAPELEGCPPPKEEEVVLESERIRIKGNILFETGMAIIQKQSYPLLDDVAKVLKDNPDVGPVLIEGHTDNRGSRPYNMDLSNRRAAAVADYLVTKKIERKRLRTAGFGFDRPVATNDTPLGRAKNRRTEFRLVHEDSDAPTGPNGQHQSPGPSPAPPPEKAAAPAPAQKPAPAPAPAPAPKPAPAPDAGTPPKK
jgi:outer membrane protein OmpA-like peptidoglycan-associated protein